MAKPQIQATNPQNKKNPRKFYSHFLFKALIVTIFLVILPIFPSEPPDFVSPSVFTRSWELFHLIFVGIAVSYGLFSRKNDDLDGDDINHTKLDNAQSYVSKLLQVPSVFDDDVDNDNPSGNHDDHVHDGSNGNKVQTWNSQCYRNQPVVVVAAKNGSFVDEDNSRVSDKEKPLLLPVRSLKSRVLDGNNGDRLVNGDDSRVYNRSYSSPIDVGLVSGDDYGGSRVYARTNSSPGVNGFSYDPVRLSRNGSNGVVNENSGGGSRSLSRSNSYSGSRRVSSNSRKTRSGSYGNFDVGDMVEEEGQVEKVEQSSVVLPSPIPWRSRSMRVERNGGSSDSPSLPLNPTQKAMGRTRSLDSQSSRSKSSSPPPEELSPSPSLSSPKKPSPSPTVSPEFLGKNAEDYGKRKVVYSFPPPPPPPPPPRPPLHRPPMAKSSSSIGNEEIARRQKDLKRSVWSEPKDMGGENTEEFLDMESSGLKPKARDGIDSSLVGKSVRTVRAGDKTREIEEERINEDEASETKRKSTEFNPMPKDAFSEFPQETRDFLEQVLVETEDESESDDENYGGERMENEKVEEAPCDSSIADEGPDVDKKADEFIAKFREQIRLQRIESIKRSTGQLKRSSMR